MSSVKKTPSFFSQVSARTLWWFSIIATMVLGVVLSFMFFFFQIKEIDIPRNEENLNIRYTSIIQILEYAKDYNILFLSTESLEDLLLKRFQEINKISIIKSFPKTLQVHIEPDELKVQWVYSFENIEQKYFGFLTMRHVFLEHGPQDIVTIFDVQPRNKKIEFYSELQDGEYLEVILNTKETLQTVIERKIATIEYLRDAQEIHYIDEKGVSYWFYLPLDMDTQIQKLSAFIEEKNALSFRLDYVDLRISNKVIYK